MSSLALVQIASWSPRRWVVGAAAAAAFALVTGIPTDVVPTSLYRRMTPVTWWDYPMWAASAVLVGFIAATYVRAGPRVYVVQLEHYGIAPITPADALG